MRNPYPGEFFGSGTGTVPESGANRCCCGLEMGRFLKAGDTVELEVERIGRFDQLRSGADLALWRRRLACPDAIGAGVFALGGNWKNRRRDAGADEIPCVFCS